MDPIKFLTDELDREAKRSRRALAELSEDQRSWKPHDRSMEFGYLADMVATVPTWITMILTQDELDVAPQNGERPKSEPLTTRAAYIAALDAAVATAREALKGSSEAHLQTRWKLLAGGTVVSDTTRFEMITDTINHWVHHRGQMTVYLRLMGAKVPALYGPSADDKSFG
ncbi:MAG: DinB family protein [Acidobacteriota bacterium]